MIQNQYDEERWISVNMIKAIAVRIWSAGPTVSGLLASQFWALNNLDSRRRRAEWYSPSPCEWVTFHVLYYAFLFFPDVFLNVVMLLFFSFFFFSELVTVMMKKSDWSSRETEPNLIESDISRGWKEILSSCLWHILIFTASFLGNGLLSFIFSALSSSLQAHAVHLGKNC